MKMNRYLYILLVCLLYLTPAWSQVTIGVDKKPAEGAVLDLRTINTDDIINSIKGMGLPRVKLENLTSLEPIIPNADEETKKKHTGLIVYNVTTDLILTQDIYVWDGVRWVQQVPPDEVYSKNDIIYPEEDNTALYLPNCYMVSPGGSIDIPVAKAYAVWETYSADNFTNEDLTGNVTAELLWQDKSDLLTNTSDVANWSLPVTGVYRDAKIRVEASNQTGNAVIALSIGGEIRWSWHIWVTDYDPDNPVSPDAVYTFRNGTTKGDFIFMDRNLGAGATRGTECIGPHYQWGRKDPIPPYTYFPSGSHPIYGKLALSFTPVSGTNNLALSIKNPVAFIYNLNDSSYRDWYTDSDSSSDPNRETQNDILWDEFGKKAPFDPCPEGWRVPPYKNAEGPWAIMSAYPTPTYNSGLDWDNAYGFYPMTRHREYNATTNVLSTSFMSYYHLGSVLSSYAGAMRIYNPPVSSSLVNRGIATNVRCIKE